MALMNKSPRSKLGFHCENPNQIRDRVVENNLMYVELYNIDRKDLLEIKKIIVKHNLKVGVHSPLIIPDWYPYIPTASFLLGDAGIELKAQTLRLITQTLQDAEELGAEYIVVHYPKPAPKMHIKPGWKPRLEDILDSADQLAKLVRQFNIRIHIEGFGEQPFLSADFLMDVLNTFPELSYCFDVGHIFLASKRGVLEYFDFLKQIAPRIGSIHLWNTRGHQDYSDFSHLPIHPAQTSSSGWIDIKNTLHVAYEQNPDVIIIFEHGTRNQANPRLDYREGIMWVSNVLNKYQGKNIHIPTPGDEK